MLPPEVLAVDPPSMRLEDLARRLREDASSSRLVQVGAAAVCAPGDLIAIESPTYFGILQVIEALDLRVLEIPCDPAAGLDLDALRYGRDRPARISPRSCLITASMTQGGMRVGVRFLCR